MSSKDRADGENFHWETLALYPNMHTHIAVDLL